jgi:RNA polymerase sigma-70 factor (ECF subfamily)
MAVVRIEVANQTEDAVKVLLLSHLNDAYRLATCILRDASSAEDAVQEAALRAWIHRGDLRDSGKAEAWFSRIVVNVCRVELARRARKPVIKDAEPIAGPPDWSDARDEVNRAVARLTLDEQIVVAMRFGRDLTVPHIAALTGIREGTVKSRLHNAQQHLRAALEAERRAEEVGR